MILLLGEEGGTGVDSLAVGWESKKGAELMRGRKAGPACPARSQTQLSSKTRF